MGGEVVKQRKRLLSLICVALMTIEFLPTQLIANATLNSNEVKEVEESENKDIQKEDSDTKKEVVSEWDNVIPAEQQQIGEAQKCV